MAFSGQVAIVTGGAQGLGEAISRMLVQSGAALLIFDINKGKAEALASSLCEEGHSVLSYQVDVSDQSSVEEGFKFLRSHFPKLDIMINCAGIVGPNGCTLDSVEVQDFDKVYEVNVRGSFLMTKYSLLEMKKNDYGRILLVASIAGKEGNAGMSAYSCSKAAVVGMVKSVGKEYATSGITVNALAPAVIRTAMVDAMDPAQVKYMTDKIPMKRCCSLDEVAALTRFIVSKEASFNTATCFDLTGGRATY